MTIEQSRSQVKGSIWQAIAQSGVDLSSLPQEQQEKLVNQIADNVLVTVDSMLDEVPKPPPPDDEFEEQVLWQGRPFLSMVESYVLTTDRVKVVKGMVSRDIENFELVRIQDIDLSQGVSERMFGIGDITIRGTDASDKVIVLRNIAKPEEVYELLRRTWLEARKRHGLQFREYM